MPIVRTSPVARTIPYDPTGLVSTDVQAALEEVDAEIIPQNIIRVMKNPGHADFLTITAALASITTASSSNPFLIQVGPGVYSEPPLTMKEYVYIRGSGDLVTQIVASNPNAHFITAIENSSLERCFISGVTGSGFAAIYMASTTTDDLKTFICEDVIFGNNDTHVIVSATSVNNLLLLFYCKFGGQYQFNNGFKAMTTGAGVARILMHGCRTSGMTATLPNYVAYATGTNCQINTNSCQFTTGGLSTGACLQADNGATMRSLSTNIRGFGKAIYLPNTGSATSLHASGLVLEANTQDIQIDHTGAVGNVLGVADIKKITNSAILLGMTITDMPTGVTSVRGLRTKLDPITVSNSTLTLVGGSAMAQVFTGTVAGQILKLPDATTLMPGHRFEVWNQSVVTIIVNDNSSNQLLISVPSQMATFALKDNSTAAGVWVYSITFPAATVATWTGTRYFAVDYDNGLDTNVGYSDTSLADAGTKPIKTLQKLRQILPGDGDGQKAVVGIRNRASGATYRNIANSADDDLDLTTFTDYAQLVIRGTGTVATANTAAFSDDAADQVVCGAQIVSGTNSGGYNPTGSPTSSVISCQLNGGGAANLSAEPALLGYRVRFAYNTATSALQNAVSMIWSNTSSQITLGTNLPATPTTSDVFYIEEPAVAISRCFIFSNNPFSSVAGSFTNGGLHIVGIKFVGSTAPVIQQRGATALTNLSFIDIPNSASFSAVSSVGAVDFRIGNTYTNQSGSIITTGNGFRSNGSVTASTCQQVIITHHVTNQARPQILGVDSFTVGTACVSAGGIIFQNSGSPAAVTNLGGNIVGNAGSSTSRRFRSTGVNVGDAISVTRSGVLIYGCDITGTGSSPMITVKAVGCSVSINDVVGSTGNTGFGLDLTAARDCSILMGTIAANTYTGATGQDIVCDGSTFFVHADYARTDIKDAFGNHIQGSGESILGSVVQAANDANANVGQYKICRPTTSGGAVRAAIASASGTTTRVVGVSQSAFTTTQSTMLCVSGGTWIQFDATPTAGNIAYLSNATAGNAMDAPPTLLSGDRKLRLGIILRVSGTLGFVNFTPESFGAVSDGAA